MKKIILTSLLILFLTACHKTHLEQDFETRIETNKAIIKTDNEINKQEEIPKENKEENSLEQEPKKNELPKKDEIINKPIPTTEASSIIPPKEETDAIDEESIDYPIHKGRIDCQDEASCMDKSIPIQFKFKQAISNVFYLEVISKKNHVLGYFIEYNFKESKYQNNDECNRIGTNIKDALSDRVTSYECSEEGILKINTDYGKE